MKKIEIKKASSFLVLFAVAVLNTSSVSAQHFFPRFAPVHGLAPVARVGFGHTFINPFRVYAFYPTLGLRLSVLPYGFFSFYIGPDPFYFYNGIYYRRVDDYYEVVAPPLGAKVPRLPRGAKVTVIDGNKYYVYQGTYYIEEVNENNKVFYKVVGTNGVLNQQPQAPTVQGTVPAPNAPAPTPSPAAPIVKEPQVGDIVNQLPENSQPVYLNGKKYYESPEKVYYQEIIDNGKTIYKVVGK